jgi:hypothetical protein
MISMLLFQVSMQALGANHILCYLLCFVSSIPLHLQLFKGRAGITCLIYCILGCPQGLRPIRKLPVTGNKVGSRMCFLCPNSRFKSPTTFQGPPCGNVRLEKAKGKINSGMRTSVVKRKGELDRIDSI